MTPVDVFAARRRIARYVRRTPLVRSSWLSDCARADVRLKLESLQVSNSFKSRGAYNAVMALVERRRTGPSGAGTSAPGSLRLVTASAGNHGRALAAAAADFDLPLIVFTPRDAPDAKLAAIRRHGAELRADSPDYDEAERRAKAFALETGATFISPYNDPDVIAGAGTIALELLEDGPDLAAAVVPIGGGGLISGIAATLKAIAPAVRVVGVEAEASCAFQTSVRAGRLVEITPRPTLADGLGGNPDPETITFEMIQQCVDEIVTVSERTLARAMAGLTTFEHLIAEGAGAAGAAAILGGLTFDAGRPVAVILSGANVDARALASVLAQGDEPDGGRSRENRDRQDRP